MTGAIDGDLHAVAVGNDGPPMLFLHPNPLDWSCWLYQMAHFSTWYRTVAVDLPGYGRSPAAGPGLTMPDVADACWAALDRRIGPDGETGPAVVVGCSVGAWTAVHMARVRPGQVSALVLSGVGYTPGKEFAPKRIACYSSDGLVYRRTHAYEVVSKAFSTTERGRYLIEAILERDETADVPTIIEMFRALGEPDPDDFWTGLSAPTLIVTGSLDNAHRRALELRDHIPDVEIVTIEGAGHTCALEQPWYFDKAMTDFLHRRALFPPAGSTAQL